MMRFLLTLTAIGVAVIHVASNAAAQVALNEVDEATFVYMCIEHSKAHGTSQDVAFWEDTKVVFEASVWSRGIYAFETVKPSIDKIDPALITQRCDEQKALVENLDASATPASPELNAAAPKIVSSIKSFEAQLSDSGLKLGALNDVLITFVEFSNRIDSRLDVAEKGEVLFLTATEALKVQKSALEKYEAGKSKGKKIAQINPDCFAIRQFAAELDGTEHLDSGNYDSARGAIIRSVLWKSADVYRQSIGGPPLDPNSKATEYINKTRNPPSSATPLQRSVRRQMMASMDTVCLSQTKNVADKLIYEPASEAKLSISKRGLN